MKSYKTRTTAIATARKLVLALPDADAKQVRATIIATDDDRFAILFAVPGSISHVGMYLTHQDHCTMIGGSIPTGAQVDLQNREA